MLCVLCGFELDCPWGHNPWPASKTGRCCDACNSGVVIPNRMFQRELDLAKRAGMSPEKVNRWAINEIKAEKRAAKAEETAKRKAARDDGETGADTERRTDDV